MITLEFQNCFIFILLCLFPLLCYYIFFKKPSGLDLPPSPPSLPIIGHLHLLLSALLHRSLLKLSSKYGPILYLHVFSFHVSSSPQLQLLMRSSGHMTFISAPYGDYWKFMKKVLVTNLLGPQAQERSRGIRANELERFYMNLFDKAMKKESVEINKETLTLTNYSISKMIMGRSCSEERFKALATELDVLTKKLFFANMLRAGFKKLFFANMLRAELIASTFI
ncbi:PREDICTED: cytochrome P450 705A20-like [Camelina sativa]|uniref:Cytochrome P450 705A20-like n=1 Tax=Camelina sativa TaxID=90675 RepID=A0ABM1RBM5_CAMSA|nr:PREDICTED: cytochrome P450 705A20-like [Camelina sativa]